MKKTYRYLIFSLINGGILCQSQPRVRQQSFLSSSVKDKKLFVPKKKVLSTDLREAAVATHQSGVDVPANSSQVQTNASNSKSLCAC